MDWIAGQGFLSPGLRFFHQGQFEGARMRVPTHLCRGPVEAVNPDVREFYARLLRVLKETEAFREGAWSQLLPQPAWSGNLSSDGLVACVWIGEGGRRHVVVVNYAGIQGQCRLFLPFAELKGRQVRLTDVMGTEVYDRDGSDLADNGLFIDRAPWHFNVFELRAATG